MAASSPAAPAAAAAAAAGPKLSTTWQMGTGISTWQCSGEESPRGVNGGSNWTRYTHSTWPFTALHCLGLGLPAIRNGDKLGSSCGFWTRFREDLRLTKELGCTSFRFSFEWARVEPVRGQYDQAAIKRFHEMLDVMQELGLEPNVTLHHFTHPAWFEDLGGFQREANIPLFVEWAAFMFRTFHSRIRLWATFNEPTAYTFLGWIVGMGPPGYIFNLTGAGRVLLNMLKAHTLTYNRLKDLPGGAEAQIGLVHHHIRFRARGNDGLHTVARWLADWLTEFLGWNLMDRWMMTGEYVWKLPVVGTWMRCKNSEGKPPPCDWWGVNYYSEPVVSWFLQPACDHHQIMTDMYYPIYPEGLYNCIQRSSRYGLPMYVTETGIADNRDDRRALLIDSYFKAVLRALADGYDVRGIYYWTLTDCFEWATGFSMKFGLYAWEPDGSVDRVLKDGALMLVRLYSLPTDLRQLRAIACKDCGVQQQQQTQQALAQTQQQEQQQRQQQGPPASSTAVRVGDGGGGTRPPAKELTSRAAMPSVLGWLRRRQ